MDLIWAPCASLKLEKHTVGSCQSQQGRLSQVLIVVVSLQQWAIPLKSCRLSNIRTKYSLNSQGLIDKNRSLHITCLSSFFIVSLFRGNCCCFAVGIRGLEILLNSTQPLRLCLPSWSGPEMERYFLGSFLDRGLPSQKQVEEFFSVRFSLKKAACRARVNENQPFS